MRRVVAFSEIRRKIARWCCPSQYTPAIILCIVWCQQSDVLGHLTLLLQNRGKHGAWALSSGASTFEIDDCACPSPQSPAFAVTLFSQQTGKVAQNGRLLR